jgi:hypothetical protein
MFARILILALSLLVATNAFAAKVSIVPQEGTLKGNLFVNRGKGFEPILQIIAARTGDSVVASGTGRAIIVYEDGCRVEVSSTTAVVTVQETSPCKGSVVSEVTGGRPVGKYAVGAVLVGGAVAAAVLVAGGGGDDGVKNDGTRKKKRDQPSVPASP